MEKLIWDKAIILWETSWEEGNACEGNDISPYELIIENDKFEFILKGSINVDSKTKLYQGSI